MESVDPEGWLDFGGDRGALRSAGTHLIVKRSERIQLRIEELLERLRAVIIEGRAEDELRPLRRMRGPKKQEGPPNGSPSIVSPREAVLTKPAPAQEAQSSREARIQVTAARGARQ